MSPVIDLIGSAKGFGWGAINFIGGSGRAIFAGGNTNVSGPNSNVIEYLDLLRMGKTK